ncbi:MAG: hypothetical protein EZS28_009804 [Streblomastix strix]|uniref:Uncharacterized protein n=1 Tax=Streblomastix strix TaxID=222440 RepID=A0A5J4WK54_9EUKA|nr:MAG: hypothetical protein EZS28_009804 [Streblomastix strix]
MSNHSKLSTGFYFSKTDDIDVEEGEIQSENDMYDDDQDLSSYDSSDVEIGTAALRFQSFENDADDDAASPDTFSMQNHQRAKKRTRFETRASKNTSKREKKRGKRNKKQNKLKRARRQDKFAQEENSDDNYQSQMISYSSATMNKDNVGPRILTANQIHKSLPCGCIGACLGECVRRKRKEIIQEKLSSQQWSAAHNFLMKETDDILPRFVIGLESGEALEPTNPPTLNGITDIVRVVDEQKQSLWKLISDKDDQITDDEDERRSNSISSESNESNQTVSDTGSDNDNYSDADNSDNESESISSSSEQSGDEQQQRNNGRIKMNKNKNKNIHEQQQQFIDDGDVSEQEQWNTTNTSVNINGINVNVSDIYDEQELEQLENGNNNNNNNNSTSSSQNTQGKQNSRGQNGSIVQGWTAEITSLFLCWLVVQRAMEEQLKQQQQQKQDGNGNESQSKTRIEKDIDGQTQPQLPTQQSQQQHQQQSSLSSSSTSSTQQQQQYPTLCSSPFSFDEVPSSQLPDLTPQLFAHSGGWAFIEFIRIVAAYTKLFRMKKEDIENQGPFQDKIRIKDQNLNGNLIGNEKIKGNGKGISIGQQKKRQQQTIEKRFDDKQANVFEKIPALSEFIEQQDILREQQLQWHLQHELLLQQQQQQQQQSTSSQSIKEQTSSIFSSAAIVVLHRRLVCLSQRLEQMKLEQEFEEKQKSAFTRIVMSEHCETMLKRVVKEIDQEYQQDDEIYIQIQGSQSQSQSFGRSVQYGSQSMIGKTIGADGGLIEQQKQNDKHPNTIKLDKSSSSKKENKMAKDKETSNTKDMKKINKENKLKEQQKQRASIWMKSINEERSNPDSYENSLLSMQLQMQQSGKSSPLNNNINVSNNNNNNVSNMTNNVSNNLGSVSFARHVQENRAPNGYW